MLPCAKTTFPFTPPYNSDKVHSLRVSLPFKRHHENDQTITGLWPTLQKKLFKQSRNAYYLQFNARIILGQSKASLFVLQRYKQSFMHGVCSMHAFAHDPAIMHGDNKQRIFYGQMCTI
jgi:hypothetical protein